MNKKDKIIIVQCIKEAYIEDIKRIKEELKLKTFNCKHSLSRDLMNTYVDERLYIDRFIVDVFQRGPHRFIKIYDIEEKTIYSIMKDKTFKDLAKKNKRANVHYLEAFASLNNEKTINNQISFFEDDEHRKNQRNDLFNKIVKDEKIIAEVKEHKLITFDIENNDLYSISIFQLNSNLDIINEESWNEYISVSYDIDYDNVKIKELSVPTDENTYAIEEEISLGIKGTNIEIKVK